MEAHTAAVAPSSSSSLWSMKALSPSPPSQSSPQSQLARPLLYRAISETDSYVDITVAAGTAPSVDASCSSSSSPNSRTASPMLHTRQLQRASAMQLQQGRASPSASGRSQHVHPAGPGSPAVSVQAARSPALSGRFLFSPPQQQQQQEPAALTSAHDFVMAFGAFADQEDAETAWHSLRCGSHESMQQQQQLLQQQQQQQQQQEDELHGRRKSTPLSFLLPPPTTTASPFAPLLKHSSMLQQSPRPAHHKQLDVLTCSLVVGGGGGGMESALLLPYPPREGAEQQQLMHRNSSAPEYPSLYEEEDARQHKEEEDRAAAEAAVTVAAPAPPAAFCFLLPPPSSGSGRASPSHVPLRLSLSRPGSTTTCTTAVMHSSPTPFTPRLIDASPSLVVRQALRLTPQPFLGSAAATQVGSVTEGGFMLPPAPRGLGMDSNGALSSLSLSLSSLSGGSSFPSEPVPIRRIPSIDSAIASAHQHPQSMPQRAASLFRSSPLRDARPSRFMSSLQQQQQQGQQPSSAVSSICASLYDDSTEANIVAPVPSAAVPQTQTTLEAFVPTLPSYLRSGSSDGSIGSRIDRVSAAASSLALSSLLRVPASILLPSHARSSTSMDEEPLEEPFAPLPLEMQRPALSGEESHGSGSMQQGGSCSTGGTQSLYSPHSQSHSQSYSHSQSQSQHSGRSGHSSHSSGLSQSSYSSQQQLQLQMQQSQHHAFNSSHSSAAISAAAGGVARAAAAVAAASSPADVTSSPAESFLSRALSSPMWPHVPLQCLSSSLAQFLATPLGQSRLLAKLRAGAVLRQHGTNLRNIVCHEFAGRDASINMSMGAAAAAAEGALSSRASLPLPALSEEIDDEGASARSISGAPVPAAAPVDDEYSSAIGSPAASAVSYRFIWLRGHGASMEVCWARLRDRAHADGHQAATVAAPTPTPMGSFPVSWLSGVCTGADSPTFSFCRVHALSGAADPSHTPDVRRCLSLLLNSGDSLDLECASHEETDSWMRAFVFLHRYALKEEHAAAQGMGSRAASMVAAADGGLSSPPLLSTPALPAAPSMAALPCLAVGKSAGWSCPADSHSEAAATMDVAQRAAVISNVAQASAAEAAATTCRSVSAAADASLASLPAQPLLLPASSSLGARLCTSSAAIGVARASSSAYRQQSQPRLVSAAAAAVAPSSLAPTAVAASRQSSSFSSSQFSDDQFALLCAAVMLQMGPDGYDAGSGVRGGLADGDDCAASLHALDSSSDDLDADSILLAELVNPAAWSTPLAAASARHSHAHRQACISIVHRWTAAQRMLSLYQRDHARLSSRLSAELAQKRRRLAQLQQQSALYRTLLEQSKAVNVEWKRRMPELSAAAAAAAIVLPPSQQRSWVTSAPAVCSARTHVAATTIAAVERESILPELVPSPALIAPSTLAALFPPLRASQLQVSVLTPASVVAASASTSVRAPKHHSLSGPRPADLLSARPPSGSHVSTDSSSVSSDSLLSMLSDSGGSSSGSGGSSARSSGTSGRRTLVSMSSDGTPTTFRHSSRNNGGSSSGADSARSNSTATSEDAATSNGSSQRSASAEERCISPRATSSDRDDAASSDGSRASSDPASAVSASSSSDLLVALPSTVASKQQLLQQSSLPSACAPVESFVLPPCPSLLEIPRQGDAELL